jgi:hypothetical protein
LQKNAHQKATKPFGSSYLAHESINISPPPPAHETKGLAASASNLKDLRANETHKKPQKTVIFQQISDFSFKKRPYFISSPFLSYG